MSLHPSQYCLDANVLIEAWQKYYSPKLCPNYWQLLENLAAQKIIFVPDVVYDEIEKIDDELSIWMRKVKGLMVRTKNESVGLNLRHLFSSDDSHQRLVDNKRNRSLADPWVIAFAMTENATVVTKENIITAINSQQVKIPNVCKNLGVRCINDFQFLDEINIRFRARIGLD